mmetsp:Transcript_15632/g.39859  ORF Transcript_15632/g.39859 Transcript_15632/m.39859 type:complete len:240 (-) Transcript_15632:215-934(-)
MASSTLASESRSCTSVTEWVISWRESSSVLAFVMCLLCRRACMMPSKRWAVTESDPSFIISKHKSSLNRSLNSSTLMRQVTMFLSVIPFSASSPPLTPGRKMPSSHFTLASIGAPSTSIELLPFRCLRVAPGLLPPLVPAITTSLSRAPPFPRLQPSPSSSSESTVNRVLSLSAYIELAMFWALFISPSSLFKPLWPRFTLASSAKNHGGGRRQDGECSIKCSRASRENSRWISSPSCV